MKSSHEITPKQIRKIIIEESKRANVGHIGSALSIADILAVLFQGVLHGSGTNDPAQGSLHSLKRTCRAGSCTRPYT